MILFISARAEVCHVIRPLESRNFFNILNWTHILQWNVFGVHSDGQSSLLNSFVRVKFLSLSKLVMCKGVQTTKSGWCRVRLFTPQNGRLEWVGGGDRDYSCWQTPLPPTPACFGCASYFLLRALIRRGCEQSHVGFVCFWGERRSLQPVSKIRGSAPVAIHES